MTERPRYDPDIHHRRSIRLQGYDYSRDGAYFVTICTYNRECLFGSVGAGSKPAQSTKPAQTTVLSTQMTLNEYGEIVQQTWDDLVNHIEGIDLEDAFVVMPNHIHGIVVIDEQVGLAKRAGLTNRAGLEPAPTLSEIVRQLKTFSARRINKRRGTPGIPVWQRNYHERIIRGENELKQIREYIANNPANWLRDENNLVTLIP